MCALISATRSVARALAFVGLLAAASRGAQAQVTASGMRLEIAPELQRPTGLGTTTSAELLVAEGDLLFDAGRYKEAAASFERAMQLGLARPHEAASKVARSYAKLGNRKQASRWAEIAELLDSPNRELRCDVLRPMSARAASERAT